MSDTRAADPPAQQPGRPGQPGQPGQPADPYRWLENADDPAVREWTEKQEAAYRAAADGWRSRAGARERLRVLLDRVGTPSAPRPAGDRLFLARCRPGGELPELVVVEPDGTERVLVDPALVDPSGSTTLEEFEPSWDGRLLSYQLAPGGTENAVLLVLDVDSGRLLDPPIDRVRRSTVAWLPDSSGFYYVRRLRAEDQYHRRVRLHLLGTDPDTDPVVFGAGREGTQHYTVRISPDGRLLAVSAGAGTARRRDLWLADLTGAPPEAPRWRPVQQDLDARTVLRPRRGPLCHLVTDLDAPRGRLVTTTADRPTPDTWRDLIPQDPHAVLEDFAVLEGADLDRPLLLVVRTRHAVSEATVHDLADGRELTRLPLPPCSTVGRLRVAAQDAHEAWFTCTGFATPTTVLRYDARTGELTPWQEPSGAAAPSAGTAGTAGTGTNTVQTTFTSRDGTPVRMFVLSPTGAPDRPRPTLLTGYGGFGQSLTPVYSPEALAWVQAGGVYAVANLRGGGEEGEEWHRAGTLDRKQNTFDDFHAAADHLVDAGWTTPERLGLWGSSNGGLLVGAALTQRPAGCAAAACVAPLLDMARYELSGLGPSWVGEYGSAADPGQLATLLSYSPYHHVRPDTAYPAVLLAVFDGDSRVDPLHARKMCAALQHATTSARPVLLRLERGTGHGARSTSRLADLYADLLAFFAEQLGLPL
ncbi:prolyl oligopeptidase family serine peptidase [Kitasatospora sp. NBC_01302]|uniref:prolyl oligopeptidase family serine peptidase n=1 Tax=Kitasatospora sp. NBC_01302 TaxID=2903575 RepID=UPI002E109570|nr:prolyl oligopeptidase family serine peptidase [Kitasatospora sp. NBC_01302]